ncbi:hypothetical protein I350_07517 [Cryptococcus amylolentus CBS 6273]|uniref:NAD(P)-binding protein n=1 Tax=Cryptococcus amylolentus CBS 6273 TaxID=1296118 RepID=A0A1E3JAK8_9TREE|nr:hypothetical protein I350_07517 [Cryptococcus amylolentus CBS 6273]
MAIFSSLAYNWQHCVNHVGIPLFFWRRPTWSVRQMPDQSGKVVLITGGNSGTGYATALALYNAGANVTIACRSLDRAREAVDDIKKNGERSIWGIRYNSRAPEAENKVGTVDVLELDLADLGSVQRAAEEYKTRVKKLDLLYLNAGIMGTPEGQWTKQGYTLQFGTMVLAHQRFATHLMPILLSPRPKPARIVTLASFAHNLAPTGGIDYLSLIRHPDDVPNPDGSLKRGKNEQERWAEYGQSKWGNIALARYLAATYDPKELIAVAVHPGSLSTNLSNHIGAFAWLMSKAQWALSPLYFSPSDGALNQIWAGTLPFPEALELDGKYVTPFNHVLEPRGDLVGEEGKKKAVELWEWCDEQGKKFQ